MLRLIILRSFFKWWRKSWQDEKTAHIRDQQTYKNLLFGGSVSETKFAILPEYLFTEFWKEL